MEYPGFKASQAGSIKMFGSIIEVAVLVVTTACPRNCPVVPPSVLELIVIVPTCPTDRVASQAHSEA